VSSEWKCGGPPPEMERAALAGSPKFQTKLHTGEITETATDIQVRSLRQRLAVGCCFSGLACSFDLGSWLTMNAIKAITSQIDTIADRLLGPGGYSLDTLREVSNALHEATARIDEESRSRNIARPSS
jgi:hypothetical protein